MGLENLHIGGEGPLRDIPEPEEDFSDGDGTCTHPQCAVESMIARSVEQILQGINVFEYADWELSESIETLLRDFGKVLTESFTEEDPTPTIGALRLLPPRKETT